MNESSSASSNEREKPIEPNETLSGDRLCMQCTHPLVGSPVMREPQTGLLYVRCGECGTASALFEYPTVGPWLRRMKAVASGTLVGISMIVIVLVGIIAFSFALASAGAAGEAAGSTLIDRYRALGGVIDDATWQGTPWGPANLQWIGSAEGQSALAQSRFAAGPLVVLLGVNALGMMVLFPFATTLGIALMRRALLERVLFIVLLVGVAISVFVAINPLGFGLSMRAAPSWNDVAENAHGVTYSLVSGAVLSLSGAIAVAIAPALAAGLARFVLPPRDRRLVAWLWEWRGKTIPRD